MALILKYNIGKLIENWMRKKYANEKSSVMMKLIVWKIKFNASAAPFFAAAGRQNLFSILL